LSDEERAGVLKYFHVRDAKMALASQLLKHLVVARCGHTKGSAPVPWRKTVLSRDAHGKPVYYSNGDGGGDDGSKTQPVVFNVSHQAGLVVLVAAYGGDDPGGMNGIQVGIDVVSPTERRTRDLQMIADADAASPASGWPHFVDVHSDVLARSEVSYLEALATHDNDGCNDDERLRAFYALWCLREAYVKMTGEALLAKWLGDLEFKEFQVPKAPGPDKGKGSLHQGDMVTEHDIRFRGSAVGDKANVCLRSVGTDYMVCTAVRSTPTETALALPTTDAFEVLQMDDILDFVERSA
jgi:4'-phosphopantetheinyl transferase